MSSSSQAARAAPAGEVEIEVTFDINADGIVAVSAKDLETGQEQAITVTASAGLTQEEIESMIQENQTISCLVETSNSLSL